MAIFQFFQNGTFEPKHKIWKMFWPKAYFWSNKKMAIRKNIHNISQGPSNPEFMQEKGDFLNKPCRKLFVCFVLGSYESLESLDRWMRSGYFFCHLKTCTGSVFSLDRLQLTARVKNVTRPQRCNFKHAKEARKTWKIFF